MGEFLRSVVYSRSSDHKYILWLFSKVLSMYLLMMSVMWLDDPQTFVLSFLLSEIDFGMWLSRPILHYWATAATSCGY